MKKRGQLLGTPFVMIFALVVGAMILIGGLYYVYKLTITAEQISIAKEINDFKAQVRTYYYLEEGNTKTVKIALPAKAKNVCFYDYEKGGWTIPLTTEAKNYPQDFTTNNFYKTFFKAYTETTMFVLPTKEFKQSAFKIPDLKAGDKNPTCIRNNGYVKITSMGDHVEIEAA